MAESRKREIPSGLKQLLDADVKMSKEFVEFVNKKYPSSVFRTYYKQLEVCRDFFLHFFIEKLKVSCHGIPWLFIAIAGLYTFSSAFFFNLLLALLLDIAVVAVIKAFTRRRRPAYNVDDQYATVNMVDKFSFPSGHSTRAVMLVSILVLVSPVTMLLWPVLIVWSGAVCVSRVLLGRHHILDVVAGVVIGVVQALVMGVLWRSEEQTKYLMSLLGDEDPWSSA